MGKLTHVDGEGRAAMVDVSGKQPSVREAVVEGRLRMSEEVWRKLREGSLAKGDALAVARVAGIQAAKRTGDWIPLCHPVPLDWLEISIDLQESGWLALVTGKARASWSTGVEMEAFVGVSAACLALYDMIKALDRGAVIEQIRLLHKSGGRSGEWNAPSQSPSVGSGSD